MPDRKYAPCKHCPDRETRHPLGLCVACFCAHFDLRPDASQRRTWAWSRPVARKVAA